jgi:hypothetical protein
MTAKKKPAKRVRKRPTTPPPISAGEEVARIPSPSPVPPQSAYGVFGLAYTHLVGGKIIVGVSGPSFTTFRNKDDAADWLRRLARSIETSWPTE